MESMILKKMGLNLKDSEAKAILTKYRQDRKGADDSAFDQEKFLSDLNKGLDLMKSSRKANEADLHRPDVMDDETKAAKEGSIAQVKGHDNSSLYQKIVLFIRKGILARSIALRGENIFRNSFRLLSECRSPLLTRSQLKGACQYRLNVALTDKQIEAVFSVLDPMKSGTLKTRQLISAMFPNSDDGSEHFGMSLDIPIRTRVIKEQQNDSWVRNQDAHVTYDHKFSGLVAPTAEGSLHLSSLHELETKILDKVFERSHLGANMIQSLIKYFSDAREKSDGSGISRDQMRYTLWKTFQLNVGNSDIERLFTKYDKKKTGYIPMDLFIDAIIKGHALNEPLLEDPKVATDSKLHRISENGAPSEIKSKALQAFLKFVRRKFRDLINKEGRAPHYLLQSSNRMTTDQALKFLETKLDTHIDPIFLNELAALYDSRGLFDMKLLLRDCMAQEDEGLLGRDQNLLNGCTVTVDAMPTSLRGLRFTPEDIEGLLRQKITERLRNDHPLSNLHKIFKVEVLESGHDTRLVTRKGMRSVLCKFDILPSDQDFDFFFDKHHLRGDGFIEIRRFLTFLMPADNHHLNPFSPKEQVDFKAQCELAKVLSAMSGHRRRQVSCLNGPAHTRFGGEEEDEATTGIKLHEKKPSPQKELHFDSSNGYQPGESFLGPQAGSKEDPRGYQQKDPAFNEFFNSVSLNSNNNEENESHSVKQPQYSRPTQSFKKTITLTPNSPNRDPNPTADTLLSPFRPGSAPPSFSQSKYSPRSNRSINQATSNSDDRPYTIDSVPTGSFSPTAPKGFRGDKGRGSIGKVPQSPKELGMYNRNNQLGMYHKSSINPNPSPNPNSDIKTNANHNTLQFEDENHLVNKNHWDDHCSNNSYNPDYDPNYSSNFNSALYDIPDYLQTNSGNKKQGLEIKSEKLSHVKKWKNLDPNSHLLYHKYKITSQNKKTNQAEYGLYIKNLEKAKKSYEMLRTKLLKKNHM